MKSVIPVMYSGQSHLTCSLMMCELREELKTKESKQSWRIHEFRLPAMKIKCIPARRYCRCG